MNTYQSYSVNFTPGPWNVSPQESQYEAYFYIQSADHERLVAEVQSWHTPATAPEGEAAEVKANAALVAAAPDLLICAYKFREFLHGFLIVSGTMEWDVPAPFAADAGAFKVRVEAAIAAATA